MLRRPRTQISGRLGLAVTLFLTLGIGSVGLTVGSRPAVADTTTSLTIDGSTVGKAFDGVTGAFINGQARLLRDYPAAQRSDLLDLLFKPDFGASLQGLKVEIGSDVNSTSATEPSIIRSPTDIDTGRGTSLWLAQQAKRVNPALTLDALRWGTPQWVKTDADRYLYYKTFLDAAKNDYGLTFDYLGPDRNEDTHCADWTADSACTSMSTSAPSRKFVVDTLRPKLDADGYGSVKLVAADSAGDSQGKWWIGKAAQNDPGLHDALDVLGAHYTPGGSSASAQATGLPLWDSEDLAPAGSDWVAGPLDVAYRIGEMYPRGGMTRYEVDPPIEAYYPDTPTNDKNLVLANTPWSGHYEMGAGLWAVAQFTQFAQPGWTYIDSGSGADDHGSYTTFKDPNTSDFSIVLVNTSASTRHYDVNLTAGLSTPALHRWHSDADDQFVHDPDITLPDDHSFSLDLPPYTIESLTTTTGQRKGQPANSIPDSTAFPLPYSDDFDADPTGGQPAYASDQGGAFEIAPASQGTGNVLEQKITDATKPVDWIRPTPDPYTLLGSMDWRDYTVQTDVLNTSGSGYVLVGGRVVHRTLKSAGPADGYNLIITAAGDWQLRAGSRTLDQGTIAGYSGQSWHTIQLKFSGRTITATVDGEQLSSKQDDTFASGQAELGSGYQPTSFDNLAINPIGGNTVESIVRYDNTDPRLTFQGAWQQQGGGYDNWWRSAVGSTRPGDTMTMSFDGTSVAVLGADDVDGGQATITIDDQTPVTVDSYASHRGYRRALYSRAGLDPGQHTLTVTVLGSHDTASIDSFIRIDAVETGGGTGLLSQADGSSTTDVDDTFDVYPDGTLGNGSRQLDSDGNAVEPLSWQTTVSPPSTNDDPNPDNCAVRSTPSTSDKSFECTDTRSDGHVQTLRKFPRTGSGTLTIQFRLSEPAVGRWSRFAVNAGADSAIVLFDTDTDGLALLDANGSYHSLGTLTPDAANTVKLVINPAQRTLDAYLHGIQQLNDVSYTDPSLIDLNSIEVRTGQSTTGTVDLAAVSVQRDQ